MSETDPNDPTRTFIPLNKGTMVLHYRIVEKIGAGGMGEVYLADDTRLNRPAALKFLPAHMSQDPTVRARFTREGQAAAKLDHPNIITIYEVGEFKDRPFLAMQYVSGKTLSHYCDTSTLSVNEIISLISLVCEGLAQAHKSGVTHRDVKSANIIVDNELRPRILDFGLASLHGTSPLTQTGSTLGTVAYMSPEQVQGLKVDHRSDLFSLGVVLYELITGHTPFRRDTEAATIHAILHEAPEPLARYRANVPDELQRIVTKLLERNVQMRYQTASDVIADLRKLSISGGVSIVPLPATRSLRKIRWVGIPVVLLLAVALYWLPRQFQSEDSASPVNISMTAITSDGRVTSATLSPDGLYMAFVRADSGLQSLWILHLSSGSKVQIVEPTTLPMGDISFTPDGGYLYYRILRVGDNGDLFRVPVLGGSPQLILSNVWSKVALAPDGRRMAFHRFKVETGSLAQVIANADGTGERELITTPPGSKEYYYASPAWSPDGHHFAWSKSVRGTSAQTLLAILDTSTGHEEALITGEWTQELSMAWLPKGGLIVASDCQANPFGRQIWKVDYPGGTLRRITHDLNDYSDVSLTSDGKRLAVVQRDVRAGVWIVPFANPQQAKQVLRGKYDGVGGVAWADSHSIVFFGRTGDAFGLNKFTMDGEKLELLAKGSPIAFAPSVSRDGGTLIYQEMGVPYSGIVTCSVDGRNRNKVTPDGAYYSPDISSDAQWVVYSDEAKGYPRMIRVSLANAETYVLGDTTKPCFGPRISPDGRWVACYMYDTPEQQFKLAVFPSEGGPPTHVLVVPPFADAGFTKLIWTPDGSSLLYQDLKGGVSNICSQPITGGPAHQITNFHERYIRDFDLSDDGKQLVVCQSESSRDVVLIEGF